MIWFWFVLMVVSVIVLVFLVTWLIHDSFIIRTLGLREVSREAAATMIPATLKEVLRGRMPDQPKRGRFEL